MKTIRIFLASSSELLNDREQFELFINRRNKLWINKGIFLYLEIWEDFVDVVSQSRIQDEYNKAIKGCDIFVMLFFTKVGQYTEEEFEIAIKQFKESNRPHIFTFFKTAEINTSNINKNDTLSLLNFQEKLKQLGHYYTRYKSADELLLKFGNQLDKLIDGGVLKIDQSDMERSKFDQMNAVNNKNIVTGRMIIDGDFIVGDISVAL